MFYADEKEWSGELWKLKFNSYDKDEHGYFTAQETIKQIQGKL